MLSKEFEISLDWYKASRNDVVPPADQYCATRDVFEGRLSKLLRVGKTAGLGEGEIQLLTAAVGELGNNAFDHNLGHWRDLPGCCYGVQVLPKQLLCWVADRGRGVLASLRKAAPELATHQKALEMAFEKIISGRIPEKRGNGLKFVRSVINGNRNRGLVCYSGDAVVSFGGKGAYLRNKIDSPRQDFGTFVVVTWSDES